jgi:hypothetical protein
MTTDSDQPAAGAGAEVVDVGAAWSLPVTVRDWDPAARTGVVVPDRLPEDDLVFRPHGSGPALPGPRRPAGPWPDPPGPRVPAELVWVTAGELRVAPAQVVEVLDAADPGEAPGWRVALLGPPAAGQRREAVRASVHWPLDVADAGGAAGSLVGETVDVSEAGVRARVRAEGGAARPHRWQEVVLTLRTAGGELVVPASVRRVQDADPPWSWTFSAAFAGLTRESAEVVRREVLAGLAQLTCPPDRD